MVCLSLFYFEVVVIRLLTILIGLIGNLKLASALMYCLYLTMKECASDQITKEEISVTSGQMVINPGAISAFISQVESANEDIHCAFEKQVHVVAVSKQYGFVSRFWEC